MTERVTYAMVLKQPWARLVAEGVFPILIRRMNTRIRGRVAILANGRDQDAVVDGTPPKPEDFPDKAVIGSVRINDSIAVNLQDLPKLLEERYGKDFAKFYPKQYIPEKSPVFLWTLSDPRLSARPKPFNPGPGIHVWVRMPEKWQF